MQLAIALYNNTVDDDDELEFHKGDILTVLIENPNGFDGWWLCQHHDKYGLCPGNRLKLIQDSESSPIKLNHVIDSRLSTASMYDSLSNTYDYPRKSVLLPNDDYDNPKDSDFLSNLKTTMNSSPESSSRSSGIYSTNDFPLSSSSESSTTTTIFNNRFLSSLDLNQLEKLFQKSSVHSLLLDKYRQLISPQKNSHHRILSLFINECNLFLENYGYLLDRSIYKLIKENILYDLEEYKQIEYIHLSTKILQLIELQLKQKCTFDIFKKLHLEPIEEIPTEKLNTSYSSTKKLPQACHSNFYALNPLIKCYYRHINEQINLIIKRYTYLLYNENNQISLLINDGKKLLVDGNKLVFVLETLHEHLQQKSTLLNNLTRQLCETLKDFIQILKKFTQCNCTNLRKLIVRFKEYVHIIMNLVQNIQQHCSLV